MTLEEMASAIRSNVGIGLKEVGNYIYSIDQIKDEISNARSLIILQDSEKGILNPSYFSQTVDKIELLPGVFPNTGVIESNNPVLTAKIPKLAMTKDNSSILYLGPMDMSINVKMYYSLNSLKAHKYNRTIKNRPFGFVDLSQDVDGNVPVYLSNLGPAPFKYITLRAILDDPVKLLQDDGFYIDDEEFPAPLAIQSMIIELLSNRFIKYYKVPMRANEFNDQTDKT